MKKLTKQQTKSLLETISKLTKMVADGNGFSDRLTTEISIFSDNGNNTVKLTVRSNSIPKEAIGIFESHF